jgi:hypothetical protein
VTAGEQRLRPGRRDCLVDDMAVAEEDDPVGPGGELRLVGHHDTGDAPLRRSPYHGHVAALRDIVGSADRDTTPL